MRFEDHPAGWIARRPGLTLFFGNRHSGIAELRAHFPDHRFLRTRQVHGDRIIPQNEAPTDYEIEADGAWTRRPGLALCSISADCVPLLIAGPGFAMALHAGWRGVARRILVEGLRTALHEGLASAELEIWIGPHIRRESFIVRADALAPLIAATSLPSANFVEVFTDDQYRVDLERILRAQALELGIEDSRIHTLERDTFLSPELQSHRRDRENAGRQISFIVLEPGA